MSFTLDWRERPAASPFGGFFIQSRAGHFGNFEVVITWPDGGLAHYWRDNDDPAMPWHGPNLFGQGRYQGVSVMESDFKSFGSSGFSNLEVAAVTEDGKVEHWFRENGGAFLWRLAGTLFTGATGVPAVSYTGALFNQGFLDQDLESHQASEFYLAAPMKSGGFEFTSRLNAESGPHGWARLGGPGEMADVAPGLLRDRQFVGLGLALTTLHNGSSKAGWKEMREAAPSPIFRGNIVVAAVSDQGALHVLLWGTSGHLSTDREIWRDGVTLTRPTDLGHVLRPFRGRPSVLQSDFGLDEGAALNPFDAAEYGNLEVVAPAKEGGLLHFWRDNGDLGEALVMEKGWSFGSKFGEAPYDEVSLLQSSFGTQDHGNLEVIARRRDQRGFDFFFLEQDVGWKGPFPISGASVGTIAQPLVPLQPLAVEDTLAALKSVNVDFSVEEKDLREWLANPEFTPYPALAQALFRLLSRALRKPVFIDVIAFNYEETPGVKSPRRVEDVDQDLLMRSVLEGFNIRHGEDLANFSEALR